MALVVRNPPANAGDLRDMGSIPGSRRSPEEGNGNPLQFSCLENPMDRGAWRATVQGVEKSDMTEQLTLSLFYFEFLVSQHDLWERGEGNGKEVQIKLHLRSLTPYTSFSFASFVL